MEEQNTKITPPHQKPFDNDMTLDYLDQRNKKSSTFTCLVLVFFIILFSIGIYYLYNHLNNNKKSPNLTNTNKNTATTTKKPTTSRSPTKKPTLTPTTTPTPSPTGSTHYGIDYNLYASNDALASQNINYVSNTVDMYNNLYHTYPQTKSYAKMMKILRNSSVLQYEIDHLHSLPEDYATKYCSANGTKYRLTIPQFARDTMEVYGTDNCTPGK